ncbi:MAG: iron ABC transporter permease [Spirochaetaceae bacterium]|nr:iron ABC transporter permease [Spirochaetaceae bacterium]
MTEKEKYIKKSALNIYIIITLFVLCFITICAALSTGASGVNIFDVLKFFSKSETGDLQRRVIFEIRLPRALAAASAGAALALSGLLMQGVFRNPLVSPYTLGVSGGAAAGASFVIIFRSHIVNVFPYLENFCVPAGAFAFSMLTMILVYTISSIKAHDSRTLILAGVAIGYLFSALTASMKYFSDVRELPEIVFWTMGSLSGIAPAGIIIIAVCVIIVFITMMRFAWDLNAISLGQEDALSLGVNYTRIKVLSLILSTSTASTAVAFTGVIGFVGLVAPHITRILMGGDYRYSVPGTALTGTLLLLVSDTAARTIIAPAELPVGIITSFIGVPFFIYLLARNSVKGSVLKVKK